MQRPAYYIALLFALSSCKMTAETVAVTYQQENKISSRLVLKKDNTFEFAGDNSALIDGGNSTNSDNLNFLTSGTWEFSSNHIKLNSRGNDSMGVAPAFTDSISRF